MIRLVIVVLRLRIKDYKKQYKMTNKNPTDILRKEHDIVLKILDSLEKNLEAENINQAKKSLILLEKEFNKHSLNQKNNVPPTLKSVGL